MPRIKVLPIYPKFPTTFWGYQYTLPFAGKDSAMPPTGLATVAAMLPINNFNVQKIADENVESVSDEQIKNSDILFLSSMLLQQNSHEKIVSRAHSLGKKVVTGGPFATSYSDKTQADYIVSGEAEKTIPIFLEDLLSGNPQKIYTEESVNNRSSTILTNTGKVDITQTPLPRWDLLDLNRYASAAIQFSRGCPFDCEFCDITKLYGRESRTKTPEQMVTEFDALYNSGHNGSVFVVDDNFIGNKRKVRELLPKIEEWQRKNGFPYSLFTEASMDLALPKNKDILEGMSSAGFNQVFLGIESVEPEVLKKMVKPQNTKMNPLDAVRTIQNSGLEVAGGFIIGSDGESTNATKNLYQFIQEAGIPIAMPGLLTAIKGTNLYQRLETEGRLREDSTGNNTHNLSLNFIPERDEETIVKDYKELIEKLFSPKNYFERCRVLQKNIGSNNSGSRLNINGLKTLGRSLVNLAFGKDNIFTREGFEHVKYLTETVIKNPTYFGEAVAQGVKQHHFSKITQATLEADAYIPHLDIEEENFREKAGRIYMNTRKDIGIRLEKISESAHKVLENAENKYHKLHEDFRGNAENALLNLKDRINGIVTSYKERIAQL
jgi:radical SAM superfamily enzyme YgiQ (UPF0313 family)